MGPIPNGQINTLTPSLLDLQKRRHILLSRLPCRFVGNNVGTKKCHLLPGRSNAKWVNKCYRVLPAPSKKQAQQRASVLLGVHLKISTLCGAQRARSFIRFVFGCKTFPNSFLHRICIWTDRIALCRRGRRAHYHTQLSAAQARLETAKITHKREKGCVIVLQIIRQKFSSRLR